MGWRLAEAVLAGCPDIPYREFRVLVAFALDARDTTCLGMPGIELLAQRGHCSRRTVTRVVRSLIGRGLISVERRSAPGIRTVYRLQPLAAVPVDNSAATWDNGVGHRDAGNGGYLSAQRSSSERQRWPQPVASTPSYTPVTTTSSDPDVLPDDSPVEGGGPSTEQKPILTPEQAERAERNRQHAALYEWQRQHEPWAIT